MNYSKKSCSASIKNIIQILYTIYCIIHISVYKFLFVFYTSILMNEINVFKLWNVLFLAEAQFFLIVFDSKYF